MNKIHHINNSHFYCFIKSVNFYVRFISSHYSKTSSSESNNHTPLLSLRGVSEFWRAAWRHWTWLRPDRRAAHAHSPARRGAAARGRRHSARGRRDDGETRRRESAPQGASREDGGRWQEGRGRGGGGAAGRRRSVSSRLVFSSARRPSRKGGARINTIIFCNCNLGLTYRKKSCITRAMTHTPFTVKTEPFTTNPLVGREAE